MGAVNERTTDYNTLYRLWETLIEIYEAMATGADVRDILELTGGDNDGPISKKDLINSDKVGTETLISIMIATCFCNTNNLTHESLWGGGWYVRSIKVISACKGSINISHQLQILNPGLGLKRVITNALCFLKKKISLCFKELHMLCDSCNC